jgi:hypothetical protein
MQRMQRRRGFRQTVEEHIKLKIESAEEETDIETEETNIFGLQRKLKETVEEDTNLPIHSGGYEVHVL